ncbi:MAG: sulfurtransferase [Actinomycetota bacterium]|nr:sulfurtransferase [Actinomycetota bacterium]
MADYANPDALVETDFVEQHLDDSSIVLVEVDEDTHAYEKGHIPGAIALDWETELHDTPRREFVSAEGLAKLLGEKGISNDQTIVLYSGNNNWFASYAYWLFKYRGVENVKLLNGGRKKWELESKLLTQDEPNRQPTTYTIGSEKPELRIFRDEVLKRVEGPAAWVDVRSPEEFRGERTHMPEYPQEGVLRGGHIPGAHSVPWKRAANDDGTFKAVPDLKAIYEGEIGLNPEDDIVVYCRIGERSSHTWFVLQQLLGYPTIRNYDGSWTEWGNSVRVPIEKP